MNDAIQRLDYVDGLTELLRVTLDRANVRHGCRLHADCRASSEMALCSAENSHR